MNSLLDLFRFRIDETNLPLRAEQLRARVQMLLQLILPQLGLAPLLVTLMWDRVSHELLLAWAGAVYAVHATELYLWWRHHNQVRGVDQCRAWDRRFKIQTSLVAAVWGSIGVLMYVPGDIAYQALLICIVLGLVAGAMTSNPFHPPSLFIYAGGAMLPLFGRIVWDGDGLHLLLAGMLAMFCLFVFASALTLIRTFEQSQQRRFENERLVTALQERKREVEAARQAAEQANQAKSKFLATASHDLRQPLQALRLFTDALQATAKEKETARLAGQIGKSVNALVDMFDDLLDVSRLDAGIVEARPQHFGLNALFDRVYGDFAPLAQAKGLNFSLPTCLGSCGGQDCAAVVYSDPFLLERIVRNLVSNAIRYTDAGGVMLNCRCGESMVRLEVADTGIGIREEVLAEIFEEYYQVDNPHRDRRKGLGLGLAIVRRIETVLGCQIQVSSKPGAGSAFSFEVPLGDPAKLAQPFVITHSRYEVAGAVVALVEDDPDIRQLIADLLEQWGCRVIEGEHAGDVMRRLDVAELRPDLLLCDYRLPHGMTATHVIRRVRELWGGDVPALVLTGDTARDTLHEIRASGAILLHKPISPARLRAMMHFAMHGEN